MILLSFNGVENQTIYLPTFLNTSIYRTPLGGLNLITEKAAVPSEWMERNCQKYELLHSRRYY